jgi:hypothetical protein
MPALHKYFGNPVLSGIARTLFSIPLRDFHCGIRGFRKSVYLLANPRTKGMEFATEMVLRFVEVNARISEIPTTLVPDGRNRGPHLRSFPDGWRHLKLMLLFSPQFFLLLPGIVLSVIGGLLSFIYFAFGVIDLGFARADIQGGFLSVLVAAIGAQLFSAGAIAIAHAKAKGLTRFKWLPITYSPNRALFVIFVPVVMILIGAALIGKVFLEWKLQDFQHLDPISESRFNFFGGTLILMGSSFLIGAIQVRQILSKFW